MWDELAQIGSRFKDLVVYLLVVLSFWNLSMLVTVAAFHDPIKCSAG